MKLTLKDHKIERDAKADLRATEIAKIESILQQYIENFGGHFPKKHLAEFLHKRLYQQ